MTNNKIRVAVNGYGVIGKRVADAVRLQPDMELVGVSDVVSDYRVKAAMILGLPIYASLPE
jgi:glyceraldehyde-3-phosphate dehydrogenase (NAD(P))